MQNRYELVIYWSKDDQCFVVEVPELPGCVADGESYQDAVKNAELVIEEWIATAREHGRSIPEPAGRLMYAYAPFRKFLDFKNVFKVKNR